MKYGLVIAFLAAMVACADGAAAQRHGAEQIEKMAGCFAVTYRFFEDGKNDYFSAEYGLERPVSLPRHNRG